MSFSQSPAFFEALYQDSNDPWKFASSPYEQGRYRATLASLARPTYGRAYEPGCSVGVLTEALAPRCNELLASDFAPSAVAAARRRCRHFPHVQVMQRNAAEGPPDGEFDLIVFSEIGYYFPIEQLRGITRQLAAALAPGGELVAVHWRGHSADHLLHGDVVHDVLESQLPFRRAGGLRDGGFRLDSWRRPS